MWQKLYPKQRLSPSTRAGPRRKTASVCVTALLFASTLYVSAASAQTADKVIVIYEDNTLKAETDAFVSTWQASGVEVVMEVPLINGAIVRLPEYLSAVELSNDWIVNRVEADKDLDVLTLGEGGAGEGGAGEGGATPLITPFPEPPNGERPWGVLDTYQQAYDPKLYTDYFSYPNVPKNIKDARSTVNKVKVGVFDTGIDYTHSAFADKMFGTGNGYGNTADILDGIDLVNMLPGIPMDDNGHGTHIAGTIATKGFGIAPKAELYAVKILDQNAAGKLSTLIMALQWAIDHDLDVVNMSVGFRDDDPLVRQAVQNAYDAGLIMVAAAGNSSNWIDGGGAGEGGAGEGGAGEGGASCTDPSLNCTPDGHYPVMYPALYPEVIAVAAMDPYYNLASFSNDGPEIDVLAPGVDVVSLNVGNGYGVAQGTSMATPHVSGAIALMVGIADSYGVTLTPLDVITILAESTAKYDGLLNLNDLLEKTKEAVKRISRGK